MSELPLNQVLCGDCAKVLESFPEDTIDLVVTDPPYGLSFMGKDWDKTLPPKEAFEQTIRVLKPGALAFVMSSPRQDVLWRMLAMLEGVGFELRQSFVSWIYKTGFPKAYDVSKGIDKKLDKLDERKIIRENPFRRPNSDGEIHGYSGVQTHREHDTEPASDLAKKWDGWKSQTGLKPALECILMVNKPFSESTIVDNVLKWETGAINVDTCRIPFQDMVDQEISIHNWKPNGKYDANKSVYELGIKKQFTEQHARGRFPANLLVSDKAIDTGKRSKSGEFKPHHRIAQDEKGYAIRGVYGKYHHVPAEHQVFHGDVGDQSRYFDLDAWAKHHGFLDVPKPDKAERDFGLSQFKEQELYRAGHGNQEDDDVTKRFRRQAKNIHPTVKPIKLMAYLIELGCPQDGVVLDPFVGSGTTCIAAKQLARRFIGIEVNPEYVELAQARIQAHPVPLTWFEGVENVRVSP